MFWTFIPVAPTAGREFAIDGQKGHHLGRVLRVRPGERGVAVTNGRRYDLEVVQVHGDRVLARVLDDQPTDESPVALTLLQAVLPNADFDAVVEAVTAIGIKRLVAIQAARSVRHPGADRRARWLAVAESAAEQSHADRVPEVDGPMALDAALESLDSRVLVLVLDPAATRLLSDTVERGRAHTLAVGPEGGWTDEELARFARAGATAVSLGPRILRARLAPIVAAAILLHQS
jgi:16S rRNA (uracil1498-N3)-methyltransferase